MPARQRSPRFPICVVKVVGKAKAEQLIRTLLLILDVASVNRRVIEKALQANFGDFEDAVLNEAASPRLG